MAGVNDLPEGYVIDNQQSAAPTSLPDGYQIDQPTASAPGFFAREGQDLSNRWSTVKNLYNLDRQNQAAALNAGSYGGDQLSGMGTALGIAEQIPGAINGFIGNAAGSAVKAVNSLTGNSVSDGANYLNSLAKQANDAIIPQSVNDTLTNTATNAVGAYNGFSSRNPILSSDISGAANAAGLIPSLGVLSAGKGLAGDAISAVPGMGSITSGLGDTARNIKAGIKFNPEDLSNLTDKKFADASNAYQDMTANGATLSPDAGDQLIYNIYAGRAGKPFVPTAIPQTQGIMDNLKDAAYGASDNKVDPLTVADLDQYQRMFRDVGGNTTDQTAGRAANASIQKVLDNLSPEDLINGSPSAVDSLNQGRQATKQAYKLDTLNNIVQRANGNTNKLQSALTNFASNPNRTANWTSDELNALNALKTDNSIGGNAVNTIASMGLNDGHSWTPYFAEHFFGPAAPIVGTAVKAGKNFAVRGKLQNLIDVIDSGGSVPASALQDLSPQDGMSLLQKMMLQGKRGTEVGAYGQYNNMKQQ